MKISDIVSFESAPWPGAVRFIARLEWSHQIVISLWEAENYRLAEELKDKVCHVAWLAFYGELYERLRRVEHMLDSAPTSQAWEEIRDIRRLLDEKR